MQLEVTSEMARLLERGDRFALAVLIDAHGSTPQRVGARLLVRADGSTIGTLGGGCIEADVCDAAKSAIATGTPAVLDYTLNEDIAMDYGLACGGSERILVDPTYSPADLQIIEELMRASQDQGRTALLTVVEDGDRGPIVARVAIREDGVVVGDPGSLHDEGVAVAGSVLSEARPRSALLALDGAQAFVDVFAAPPEVVIVGAGHVGRAVATVAVPLGYRVVVIDDRADFANSERFPEADRIVGGDVEQAIDAHKMTRNSAVIIVTRGHKYDYQALAAAARSRAGYVGLMGSRRKVMLIYRQLIADGVPPERLRDIHAPIGLDIGAVSPEEIAVSIMAEVTMHRLGGNGGSMRDARLVDRATPKTVA
jgi:xanthine dehydrogenase accessory factor